MLKFIFKFAKKYWLSLALMLIFTVLSAKINLDLPQYTAKIITEGVAMKNMEAIYSNGFHMIGLSLLSGVLMLAGIFFASRSVGAMARDIRHATFEKIENFSMNEFGKFSVSSLTTRITNDARQFQQTFTMIMRMGIYAPIVGVGAIINTLAISGSMSWIMVATIFSIIALTTIIGIFAVPKLKIFQTKLDELNMQTRQTITGLRVIRAYRKEKVEEEKFDEINKEMLKMNIFFERIFGLISPYMTMVSGLGLIAIAWIGSYFVKSGEISIGDVTSLTQYLAQVTFAFVMLSMIFISIPRMNVAIKRLSEVLDEEISVKDKTKTQKLPKTFDLTFENVSFVYPDSEEAVLENINFSVKQGETIAVIGGTGSGKSTTLAALIDKINSEKAQHIITIEDPIEFTHKSKRSAIVQREVHYDTYSFSAALRSSLRQDPDVVLIGEMRDLETISAAITIAETGHLVFATLHTNSAAQSIDRMIDVFPPHQQSQVRSQLANILQGICAQRLVPAIGGGRVVAAEVMVANPAIRNIIREGKTHQLDTVIQTGSDQGMQTMDRTLVKLVQSGVVTYDDAREFAVDLVEFERLMRG